jgi:hypothetical protein
MAVMLSNLYDALRAGDVPDDKAKAAAEEVADFKDGIADIKSTQRLHTWILTFNTAMVVALVGKVFLGH